MDYRYVLTWSMGYGGSREPLRLITTGNITLYATNALEEL